MKGAEYFRNFTDGQYFELFKRLLQSQWIGADGVPGLTTQDIIQPRKIAVVISAGARWTRIKINRAVYLFSATGRRVDYVPGNHPGDVSAASPSPWNSSVTGVCKLFAPGVWHVKTPLISGDVEATMHPFIMTDAAADVAGDLTASAIAGSVASGDLVNIAKIGGTTQSGVDVAADFGALLLTKVTGPTAIGAASTSILAASATRRYVYIRNLEAVGGQRFSLAWDAAAELDKGRTLYPGEGKVFTYQEGATQEFRAIRSGGSAPAYELTTGVNA